MFGYGAGRLPTTFVSAPVQFFSQASELESSEREDGPAQDEEQSLRIASAEMLRDGKHER